MSVDFEVYIYSVVGKSVVNYSGDDDTWYGANFKIIFDEEITSEEIDKLSFCVSYRTNSGAFHNSTQKLGFDLIGIQGTTNEFFSTNHDGAYGGSHFYIPNAYTPKLAVDRISRIECRDEDNNLIIKYPVNQNQLSDQYDVQNRPNHVVSPSPEETPDIPPDPNTPSDPDTPSDPSDPSDPDTPDVPPYDPDIPEITSTGTLAEAITDFNAMYDTIKLFFELGETSSKYISTGQTFFSSDTRNMKIYPTMNEVFDYITPEAHRKYNADVSEIHQIFQNARTYVNENYQIITPKNDWMTDKESDYYKNMLLSDVLNSDILVYGEFYDEAKRIYDIFIDIFRKYALSNILADPDDPDSFSFTIALDGTIIYISLSGTYDDNNLEFTWRYPTEEWGRTCTPSLLTAGNWKIEDIFTNETELTDIEVRIVNNETGEYAIQTLIIESDEPEEPEPTIDPTFSFTVYNEGNDVYIDIDGVYSNDLEFTWRYPTEEWGRNCIANDLMNEGKWKLEGIELYNEELQPLSVEIKIEDKDAGSFVINTLDPSGEDEFIIRLTKFFGGAIVFIDGRYVEPLTFEYLDYDEEWYTISEENITKIENEDAYRIYFTESAWAVKVTDAEEISKVVDIIEENEEEDG